MSPLPRAGRCVSAAEPHDALACDHAAAHALHVPRRDETSPVEDAAVTGEATNNSLALDRRRVQLAVAVAHRARVPVLESHVELAIEQHAEDLGLHDGYPCGERVSVP